jgi:excisionase family DNA binding protein
MHCCAKTVRTLIHKGSLEAHKPPGCRRWLITPEAIRAYVELK